HWRFSHHTSRFGPSSIGTSFADDWPQAGFGTGFGMHRAAASDVKWEPPAEWTFWGHVDRQSFEASAYDGGVSSVYFGADADFGERWMAGFAVSSSSGEADYEFAGRGASGTGSLDTELTSVFPYLHVTPSEDAEVWAIVGAGWGDVTQSRSTTAQRGSADLSMWMASLGGRRSIASADAWEVSILGDTSMLELQTDGGIGIINGLEVGVARQRAGMEAARLVTLQDGGSLAWFGEVAARHDSGDGETGGGAELVGGVRFDSGGRLSLEAKARLLAMHAADDYEENGLSLTATVRPAPDGTGMSLSVSAHSGSGMGATGTSAILDSHQPDLRALQGRGDWGMAARIGHSLTAMRQPGSMTPFAELDVSSQRSRTMLGVRYDLSIPNASDRLNVEFAAGHGEDHYRGSGAITELRAALRF
ncbi:MAG: autotransporter outer membrane beta-barrel domain-containing protein, partial [Gammaproteobacteria bacterium]|nr:autotransporter outer membrane beta-barrel domain-containing protein [Gammaproteobacteria bacterium]